MGILGITRRQLVGFAGVLSAGLTGRAAAAERRGADGAAPYPQSANEAKVDVHPANLYAANGPLRYGAKGDGLNDDQPGWALLGKVADYHFVPWLTYLISSKIRFAASVTLVGASRGATIQAMGFPDYVVEIGSSPNGPNPQAGTIERLKIQGASGNMGLVHLQPQSHMWHLEDLLLYNSPCPALVVDGCWDSNYENIDIIQCGGRSGVPAKDCAVILGRGCNNLYFRGLRVEQATHGAIYVGDDGGTACGGAGPVYLLHGKVDLGYVTQYAPAVTVTNNGTLICSSWGITGVNKQPAFAVQGGLTLSAGVTVAGGSGVPAIQDTRSWIHVDTATFGPGAAQTAAGPYIPRLDLGDTQFSSDTIYINQITPSVIQSKIFPLRILNALNITANGGARGNTFSVFSDFRPTAGYPYVGCYLVNNMIGMQAVGRRKVLASYPNGQFILQGTNGLDLGADYSIEYCGGHYTPIRADAVQMSGGMDLFTVLQTGATFVGPLKYVPVSKNATNGGCTTLRCKADALTVGPDASGYYLVDEQTGEPYLICYGVDSVGQIGVFYDVTQTLDTAHRFSIVAGYLAGIQTRGDYYEWSFAGEQHSVSIQTADQLGFDPDNMPLWAFSGAGRLQTLPFSSVIRIQAASSNELLLTVTNREPFTIEVAQGSRRQRLLLIIRNAAHGDLGAITWDSRFRMAAWSNPAPGFSRSIEFFSDGGNLIEINRTPADVPF